MAAACALALCAPAHAARKTVCTITVNSDDEREVLKRNLPSGDYDFVELVERGRPDWLRSACQRNVRCDALVISGHFDGGTEFYTDRLDAREYLPVEEMERASCSESCPGVFSQLKEVYLFGCNTLNTQAMRSASGEVARSLVRSGHSAADAEKIAQLLADRHGESNRDRMRHIFKDVPVIYGFPGKAPLGRSAGPVLERYLRAGGEFAEGRASPRLLSAFAASGMTVASGMTSTDDRAGFRSDVCHFADDRLTPAQKITFLHELLARDPAEVRMFLDHIERYAAVMPAGPAEPLRAIAGDDAAKARFLAIARDADDPAVQVRMARLAGRLGWLTDDAQRALVIEMLTARLAATSVGASDVDLACTLNRNGALDGELARMRVDTSGARRTAHAAVLACLGSDDGRKRVLHALASGDESDAAIALAYLSHRPMADAAELRGVTAEVARMPGASEAKLRALQALARHEVADRDSLMALADSFRASRSLDVQRAIAGVLVRADFRAIDSSELARTLRGQRVKSPDGRDVIDVLIRRLDAAGTRANGS